MPYEVCYRALLSISVVEATHDGRAPPDRPIHGTMAHGSAPPLAGPRATLDHPQDRRSPPGLGLAGGPPARWFVILLGWHPTVSIHAKDTARGTC